MPTRSLRPRSASHALRGARNTPTRGPSRNRKWWALAATSFGLFMALLDVTVVNVALPTIQRDLHASFADLQWVINAYTIALAIFLVTAGRLGDIFGRKRLFIVGMAIFMLGSLFAGLSTDFTVGPLSHTTILLVARGVEGIGGSIMLPLSLAIISATFQGGERAIAIGIWGGITGLATAIGPIVGGILIQAINWQSIFYLNLPVGVIGIGMAIWAIQESRDERAPRTVDVFGLVATTVGLFCLTYGLIEGDADGWTSPAILTLFGIFVVALIAFILVELRLQHPMVDPRLFKNASYTGAAIAAFTLSAGLFSILFYLALYLQNYLGFNALDAGLRFLPLSGLIFIAAPLAGRLTNRLGAKPLMVVGLAIVAFAIFLMTRISASTSPFAWEVLIVPFVLAGLGAGLTNPPISAIAVGTVPPGRAGMGSAVNTVCRQIGTAFGIAFLGAILSSQYDASIKSGIFKLHVPGAPAPAQHTILQRIVTGIQQAGTVAGSTGLNGAQAASFRHNPLFPAVQHIVRTSWISAFSDVLYIAAILVALGAIASLLVKKSDMLAEEGAGAEQAELAQAAKQPDGRPRAAGEGDGQDGHRPFVVELRQETAEGDEERPRPLVPTP